MRGTELHHPGRASWPTASRTAGNLEPWETTVKLFVSDGQQTVTVPPGLVGETYLQAQKQLGAESLYAPEDFVPVNNPSQDGYVINSDPKSGQPIREGSAVTLYVGEYTGPPTTKPGNRHPLPGAPPRSTTAGSSTSSTSSRRRTTVDATSTSRRGRQPPRHRRQQSATTSRDYGGHHLGADYDVTAPGPPAT